MKNILYRLLLLPWLLLAAWGARAQAPTWLSANGVPVSTTVSPASNTQGVAVNANGDIFVTGNYTGSATFGSTTLNSAGGQDMYVAKWNSGGGWAWAVSGGGSGDDYSYGIALNGSNIYVTGTYNANASVAGTSLTNTGGSVDMYVAKYYDNGTTVTARQARQVSTAGSDSGRGIAVNTTTGTVYVTGFITGTAGTAVTVAGSSLTLGGSGDMLLVRYTDPNPSASTSLTDGGAVRGGGSSGDRTDGVAVSSTGTIYVVGSVGANGGTVSGTSLTTNGSTSTDILLAKYTDNGSALVNGGAVNVGGGGAESALSVATIGTTVYVAGTFSSSSITFGSTAITSPGNFRAYLARYTDAGGAASSGGGLSATGAVASSGNTDDRAFGVTALSSGIYLTGFYNTASSISGTTLPNITKTEAFVARYTDAAVPASQGAIATSNSGAISGGGTGLANNGTQVVAVGYIDNSANTAFGSNTVAAGSGSGFFARVGVPTSTVTSIVPTGANPTNATSVTFTVTFAASVTGVTTANFATVNGGSVAGSSVTSVSGSGTTYSVVVNTGSGSGTVGLNLTNDTGLTPGISNDPFTGQTVTIDKTAPTTTISSTAGGNGSTTGTSPIPFTVTFSESITGFLASDVVVTGGTISGFSGSGATYTFNVTPSSGGTVTVNVAANTAQDAVGNGNAAATQFNITYQQPLVASSQAVTVQLDANGNATLTASSVNNGSTGPGTLTYTIQKIAFGYTPESTTPLTLTTPNGANFTQIRFASYGTPNNNSNGNYSLGSCSAANSLAAAQNAYVGRSSGGMYASNTDTRNNPVLGDPCNGTPKALAVQAAYSADAANLTYDCTEAAKTQYVLLTVSSSDGRTSTSVAQVTVNPSPTATITNVSPNAAQRGATVTVTGTNLSGVTSVTVNGAVASVSGLSGTGFTFVVPAGATSGAGTLVVTTPCSQTLTPAFTVQQTPTTAPVVTTPANGSFTNNNTPAYTGTAPANSTVTVYVGLNSGTASAVGTTTADASGNFTLTQPATLADAQYKVYATAQLSGQTVSVNSNTNTFTVDTQRPSVSISSTAGASGSSTTTTPIPFTVTFSESVTGFVQGDLIVSNGTVSGFSGSGATYSFNVTPATAGTSTTVNVVANVAQDQAGNNNTAAAAYSITYNLPTASVMAVTGQTPSPTATSSVSYQVTFSASVSGLTTNNFNLTTSGLTGASVSSVSGSGNTYTVTVNTGTGDGTLRLNVNSDAGLTPALSNVPYTSGTTYTITKSFAAAPTLRIQGAGSASGNSDVTAFVDLVQVLQSGTSTVVTNGVTNGSFESNNVQASNYLYQSQGVVASPWSFGPQAGVSRNNSAFGSTAADGDAVAFLQSAVGNNGNVSQNLSVPSGSYQVRFRTMQRNYTSLDQRLNVFVNDVYVGTIQSNNIPTYDTFTSASFNVTAPALTATVSTTSASPTSTSPIPFSVSFSQSVNSTFTAADVTVTGGTLNSASFNGSGAGPYTFTVTPSGTGTVTVSLAANVATDANNTGNTASNAVSVQFQASTIAIAPASLPNGTQGTAYSQALSASGGSGTYTYAITAGALPAGLTLSSGTIAGTPTANGSFTFTVTATDNSAAPGPYSGSRAYTLTINSQPVTAAPVVTAPANGSFSNVRSVTATGTAPAGSTVSVYIGSNFAGTTPASATGTFSYVIPGNAPDGTYTVSATAQSSGATTSASSNVNTFTIDGTAPTVTLNSATVASGSSTSTSPVSFTATFNEPVTNFTSSGITVTNGTVTSGLTAGSGNTYTFQVTPSGAGNVTVTVPANAARDRAGNNNTASSQYAFTFQAPTIVVAPASLPNGTQGTAYSQALSASGGSGTYTYAITAGALPSGLTLSSGTIAGTPTTNGSFTFTVTATDNSAAPGPYSGSRAYTLTIAAPVVTVVTWTGNISSDWFTAGNWSPNTVPSPSISATIPTAPSGGRFPNISAGTANARNFTLNSGASLVQSGGTLVVAGDLTNNGTYQPTGGTVLLGNSTLSNILGSSNTRFWNLTVGINGAQQSTSASTLVQRLLSLNGGNFATNGNSFTLLSNANLTAQVTNNGGVVNGNVTVQRYIDPSLNPNLGYRHITTAVSGQTVGNLATGSFSPVVNPAYNASAQPGTVTPFPTVYGYDQSRLATATNNLSTFDKGWFSPNALSDALNVGQGYTALISGGQTWAFTGPLNNGTQTLTLARNTGATAADAGLSLVGNPYPSPLDWRQVASNGLSNVDGALYVFQSNDPSNPYAGSYGVYANGVGTANPVLAQGQGFFVRVTQGQSSGTLTFDNSQRPTTYTATNYARTAAETRPLVQLSLKAAGRSTGDDAFVYFEQGSTEGFDAQYDAMKMPNPSGLNLSTSIAGQRLSIDGRPAIGTAQRVIPLAVGVPATGAYSLSTAQLVNLDTTPVYLRDLQAGTLTDLRLTPSYQFTVSNASALITNRFELVFSPQQALATVPAALAQQVALYPNPAKKAAFVELPASLGRQAVTATLVDALGRQVRTVSLPAQGALAHQLNLSELATGVYALRLSTSAGVVVKKLVIE
jgi:hypothetical protein